MPYEVALVRCPDYDDARVRAAISAALAPLGGLEKYITPGQRVLIKLNLLSAKPPDLAVTTHPALVKAVVQMVQQLGATPIVGDSPGGVSTPSSYEALLKITGIRQVIDETGCAWVNFDEDVTEISAPAARTFRKFTVAKIVTEVDAVIALPRLKTHQFTFMTGGVKLLYGYLPGLIKPEYHLHAGKDPDTFAELLIDLHQTLPPTLTILDMIVAMEGNGPAHGTPRPVGLLLASPSATAIDFVAATIINLVPLRVPTIRTAHERGLGPGRLDEITVHGEDPLAVRVLDFQQAKTMSSSGIPPWFAKISTWLFASRPVIDAQSCVRCGKCVESCPPKTMHQAVGEIPDIDYGPCLRCYCCHELCPVGAVRIAPPRVSFPVNLGDKFFPALQKWLRKLRKKTG